MAKKSKRPEIKVGEKFHYYDRDLWHIVNVFQDGEDTMVVIKSWAKYKNRWCYKVEYKETLEWYFNESKMYKEVNSKKK